MAGALAPHVTYLDGSEIVSLAKGNRKVQLRIGKTLIENVSSYLGIRQVCVTRTPDQESVNRMKTVSTPTTPNCNPIPSSYPLPCIS